MLADCKPKVELKILPVSTPAKSTVTPMPPIPPTNTFTPNGKTPTCKTPERVPSVTFGWTQIKAINPAIPYIKRESLCLVAETIYLPKINQELKTYFTEKIYECLSHKIYRMTEEEASVFNDINQNHCDKQLVGNHMFTKGMLMIELQDLKQLVEFLKTCFEAFFMAKYENSLFGFVRIGGESDVPFVWYKQKQMLPLFYFDGQMDYLDDQSVELTEQWVLDFLKFCCLIHGIRKEHYQKSSIKVVDLALVRSLSEEGTSFKVEWPKKVNPQLLNYQEWWSYQDQIIPQNDTTSRRSFLKLPYFIRRPLGIQGTFYPPLPDSDHDGMHGNISQNNLASRQLSAMANGSKARTSVNKRASQTTVPRVQQPKVKTVKSKTSQKTIDNSKASCPKSTDQRSSMCVGQPLNLINTQNPSQRHSQQRNNLAPYIRHITNVPHQSPQPASSPTSEASVPGQPRNTQPVTILNQQMQSVPSAQAYQYNHPHKPVQLSLYEQHLMEKYFMSQMFVLDRSQDKMQAWEMTLDFMQQYNLNHDNSSSELVQVIHMRFCEMITSSFETYRKNNAARINILQNINVATMAPHAAQKNNRNGPLNNSMVPQNLSALVAPSRTSVNKMINNYRSDFSAPN